MKIKFVGEKALYGAGKIRYNGRNAKREGARMYQDTVTAVAQAAKEKAAKMTAPPWELFSAAFSAMRWFVWRSGAAFAVRARAGN